ncbi:hypothetical protein BB559_006200 [Furculomyces boomerangus]|uniref:Phosphatidyl-N-methylethanolamine N-methyltransferase n=2 Tax=Harpellales TaxID=61421 RepID=A0A2T9Y473_9FUNG|nr:hypothetical protein BB559_006200 [Furculomyces boomerangus]PVZ97192.1 hypothetical protein BB558_006862 [Smittium angustum]PWA02221.1 hypothetical protein BB558_001648 [Smittium angustum]
MFIVTKPSFLICLFTIAFNPIFWNVVARLEYRKKTLTKLFGSPRKGCYALGVTIFFLGILRDYLFKLAIADQQKMFETTPFVLKVLSALLLVAGNTLVLSSMYKLGFTGTYLGDYFGILMDDMVTSFPFNITDHPMYIGSAMSFFGVAFYYSSPAGFVLSMFVILSYSKASEHEHEFTTMIYKNAKEAKTSKKK